MSPYLPVTPDENRRGAIGAPSPARRSCTWHARNPKDGSPTQIPQSSSSSAEDQAASDVVVNLTGARRP